jgi:phosphatidylglycerol:prolipoprotein diacylglycerol transferase
MLAAIPFPSISPEIFSFDLGPMTIALRWYALAYMGGFLIAWRWAIALVRRPELWGTNGPAMRPNQPEELLTWVILGTILGGRLGFVTFYQPAYYLANPAEILMVWQGGMSFHGGFLGVIVGGVLYCRRHTLSPASVGDVMALTVTVGLFLGRIANFINAELFGRATTAPWGIIFPQDHAQNCGVDWQGICARHPSQLYEALMEGLILGLILTWGVYRRGWLKLPGFAVGVFLTGYGIARIIVELFRQPDVQFTSPGNPIGFALQFSATGGLTMGQILSIPMALAGVGIMIYAARRIE